jgi:phosphoserine phosphatase
LTQARDIRIVKTRVLSQSYAEEFYLEVPNGNLLAFKEDLIKFEKEQEHNVILQTEEMLQNRQLVVFDMDSTLIQQEVIDLIAAYANVEAEVSKITAAAMNGEIDFTESLKRRVSLLKGIPSNVFELLKPQIKFTPGAHELCKVLKTKGYKLAVLSGGFIPLANWVKDELGLDYAYANNLEVEDGVLTGKTIGRIVDGTIKAVLLREIASKENIDLDYSVAVGDGSNDLKMMAVAGLGIAFNAKPSVQLKAPSRLNNPTLRSILYILGYNDESINE